MGIVGPVQAQRRGLSTRGRLAYEHRPDLSTPESSRLTGLHWRPGLDTDGQIRVSRECAVSFGVGGVTTPSTSFGTLTPAVREAGKAAPEAGAGQPLRGKAASGTVRGDRHAPHCGAQERVGDRLQTSQGDKDQLPRLGVMTPTKLQ